MSVTAYKTPGTCATVDRSGGASWLYPEDAQSSDNFYADSYVNKDTYCDWLRATNFDFASGIPAGAIIDGIEVKIERHSGESDLMCDSAIYLRKTSGQIGDNKASASYWPTSDAEVTYGGATDKWNAGLIDTEVRNADFGVDLSVYAVAVDIHAYIDCISIRVYYTEAVTFQPFRNYYPSLLAH